MKYLICSRSNFLKYFLNSSPPLYIRHKNIGPFFFQATFQGIQRDVKEFSNLFPIEHIHEKLRTKRLRVLFSKRFNELTKTGSSLFVLLRLDPSKFIRAAKNLLNKKNDKYGTYISQFMVFSKPPLCLRSHIVCPSSFLNGLKKIQKMFKTVNSIFQSQQ